MNNQTIIQKIIHFNPTKIIIGTTVVAGSVFLCESTLRPLLDKTQMTFNSKNLIIAALNSGIALVAYIFLFRFYEKRKITELSRSALPGNAGAGFLTGLILQSLIVLVIYIFANYSILRINPVSSLLPALATAFTAGIVAEIVIVGIFFRLAEEKLGTLITLLIMMIFFCIMHSGAKGATVISVLAVIVNAGILLPAAFIFTRTLWFPMFLHFAWDFAEPGIYGGVNPGNSVQQSLFSSKINGPDFLTGGALGPQNSIQSILLCLVLALFFLGAAKRQNKFIKPFWTNKVPGSNK
ncbi:MAG TPA: CPBP family intramembrane glutamic endopeptidase [Puia sp.]|nr:CPBP family intramembrane glutamic endopeptidase [Puia sp.]